MPELPEVETMRRAVAPVTGSRIEDLLRPRSGLRSVLIAPPLREFRRRVVGRTIREVGRLGKRVVLSLDSGERIVLEPRMTGLVLLGEPPNRTHLRLVFELSGGPAPQLLFWDQRGLGVARLARPAEFLAEYGPERLGPDALEITADELRARLRQSRRPVKVALMDQSVLAGVGNLYASEILHRAGVHPARPCQRMSPAQWRRVHEQMLSVLEEAIRLEGSTLSDGTYRVQRDRGGGYQEQHRVYQRAGEPCRQCGRARIVRIVQAQRSTFFCPQCQRKG
jgi:formamidopyrimidine-DNA glycosylase